MMKTFVLPSSTAIGKHLGLTIAALSLAIHAQAREAGVLAGLGGEVTVVRSGNVLQATGGDEIYQGDQILSGSDQLFQLLLRDETTFTFGGGSEVTLDHYEFDDAAGRGKLQITQLAGQLKFATGKIADGSLSAFRIVQPSSAIAVLGTMGVTAVLPAERAAELFPAQVTRAEGAPYSYSALMGPGPYSAISAGTFVVTSEGVEVRVDQPEGTVLASAGTPPVFFFAPPLGFERSQVAATNDDSASDETARELNATVDAEDPAENKRKAEASQRSENLTPRRSVSDDFIQNLQVERIIQRMEQEFGIPNEPSSPQPDGTNGNAPAAQQPDNSGNSQPTEEPVTSEPPAPEPEPENPEPVVPETPSEPTLPEPTDPVVIDPVVPEPIDPIILDPGGGMVCPGDPECP
jgi:hypothetical protein